MIELLHNDEYFFIVTELAECGDLCQYLEERIKNDQGPFNERQVKQISKQLFSVLDYMNTVNIIHRDIKLENILIHAITEDKIIIKLTDFGFSDFCDDD